MFFLDSTNRNTLKKLSSYRSIGAFLFCQLYASEKLKRNARFLVSFFYGIGKRATETEKYSRMFESITKIWCSCKVDENTRKALSMVATFSMVL